MPVDKKLLSLIACPKCKGHLSEEDGGKSLLCRSCFLKFSVRDGIPIMLVDEAIDVRTGLNVHHEPAGVSTHPAASFKVIAGPDTNLSFQLVKGACRAIGRATVDPNKTQVFNVDIALELDESTKRLVLEYIGKQFKKSGQVEGTSRVGSFRRVSDVILSDSSLSRLHAMFFHDDIGIAVLDLVSKNGTFVNGKEIESRILSRGDVIEMGETTITFEG